ncbi:amino acid ABC transporter ATP-binding protein [Pedococcus sp. 5OH_020]|uniref:amino acid ABC transporter ATP-binding protein n=1 Tax=Pedococcus sp. 5OH_020 TaxID=2989814 RepID=UPI0022E9BB63|nr:amino acid ABC transporter ATP-binding protein [Pedococcus sp. 5OH_020]
MSIHTETSPTETAPDVSNEFVRAEHLVKDFGQHRAVNDVSLSVAKGEVIALIGPSGAGKSTLLRCLNLLETPSSGSLQIAGERIVFEGDNLKRPQVLRLRRHTGMVFQSFNLFPHLTAAKNVALAQMRVLGRSKKEAMDRALTQLDRVGLASKADAYPSQCSGGQQQRIGIARALAMDPDLMLFDEPTSGLDPEVGAEILAVMRALAGEGTTMIIATHEMEFARHVSHRVVVMVEGAIIEEGAPEQVMSAPTHERTQKFLSAVLGR